MTPEETERKVRECSEFELSRMKTKSVNALNQQRRRGHLHNRNGSNLSNVSGTSSRRGFSNESSQSERDQLMSGRAGSMTWADYRKLIRKESKPDPSAIHWRKEDKELGRGAFGIVYRAIDKRTGEIIAVKEFRYTFKNKRKTLKEFEKEARIMKKLRHRNIVEFKGYKVDDSKGIIYLLMEYVPGNSIEFIYLKKGKFSERMIQKYVYQMVQGLHYAHQNHCIHRDIKGKNVLIDDHGLVKIADFGNSILTEKADDENSAFTMDFQATPLWTAPEAFRGSYDFKYDIWALGCVIIEMASAKHPWSECKFKNAMQALFHIGKTDERPDWPKSLSVICQNFLAKCLQRDPNQRYDTEQLLQHRFLTVVKPRKGKGYTVDHRAY